MRPDLFRSTIPFDDALRQVLDAAVPIARTLAVSIENASGRVAASDVIAEIDVPPFDRAAMDGYAVRSTDLTGAGPAAPVAVACVDRVFTGAVSSRTIGTRECAEIGTGAPIPAGADAVVMVERTSRQGDSVTILESPRPGQNIGRRGCDIAAGQPAIHAGDVISPARAGALAAIGRTSVDVFGRPRIAILATGPEVAPPGQPLGPGRIYDINGVTLSAVVSQHGADPVLLDPVEDTVEALVEALQRAAVHDVVVTSGGSSVGERDLLLDAVERCGSVAFHGIAVKPGKPTLFGHIGGTPIFGMPGNPTSCLSNAYILLVPFLRQLARLPAWRPLTLSLPLSRPVKALPDRHQFYAVRIREGSVEPAFKSSGDITSMASADGYIEVPAGTKGLEAGDVVRVVVV